MSDITTIGQAISAARSRAGLSLVQLSKKTRDLGHPVHRVALGKIESGAREITVSELKVIARALVTAPLQLIYPDLPFGPAEIWPGKIVDSMLAVQIFSGEVEVVDTEPHELAFRTPLSSTSLIALSRQLSTAEGMYSVAEREVREAIDEGDEEVIEQAVALRDLRGRRVAELAGRVIEAGGIVDLGTFPRDVQDQARLFLEERREAASLRRSVGNGG